MHVRVLDQYTTAMFDVDAVSVRRVPILGDVRCAAVRTASGIIDIEAADFDVGGVVEVCSPKRRMMKCQIFDRDKA